MTKPIQGAAPSVEGRRAAERIFMIEDVATKEFFVNRAAEIIDESHRDLRAERDELRLCVRDMSRHLQHSFNPKMRCGQVNTHCTGCILRERASKILGEKS